MFENAFSREFARRVAMLQKLDMFKGIGRHTFFIPVDEAFNVKKPS